MKKSLHNKKLFSIILTSFILLLLLFLGSANAVNLAFSVMQDIVTRGDDIHLEVEVKIEQGELLDLTSITIILNGPQNLSCEFSPDGNPITTCPGVQIEKTRDAPFVYGYGYGYGYQSGYAQGTLKYNVHIDTTNLPAGEYLSSFFITTKDDQTNSEEKTIFIEEPPTQASCSVRGTGGITTIDATTFTQKNKLNLYTPSFKAKRGKGTLILQDSKRISYTFTVRRASNIGNNRVLFDVTGTLHQNTNNRVESARIILDKNTHKLEIMGPHINAENMDVSFLRC